MSKVNDNTKYAEVYVEVAGRNVDRPFHYIVPSHLQPLKVGSRVEVTFGSRTVAGYVVGYSSPPKGIKLKPVQRVIGEGLTPELIKLARWMSQRYICTFAESLHCVLGSGREIIKLPRGLYTPLAEDQLAKAKLTPKQYTVMINALAYPGLNKKQLAHYSGVSTATVDTLIKKKMLHWASAPRAGAGLPKTDSPPPIILTPEQQRVVEVVSQTLNNGSYGAYLLHGVTGSGKTEVYMRIITTALAQGKNAIVLMPEISLTTQMVSIFRSRFGGQVAVLHSRLSAGERYSEWLRIRRGDARVVLGARSAIFAPIDNLGIIVMDEEHESSYKQDENPKYHTREVALRRAKMAHAVMLMGSATPSLESYCRAEPQGPYKLLQLPHRVANRTMPAVQVVDMRQELYDGCGGLFSRPLLAKMAAVLEKGQQTVLFLNRRGYATFVVCRKCGLVLKCPQCDISLTYHFDGVLRCHYCNHSKVKPQNCPQCKSDAIGYFGIGTQKVEEEICRHFPGAKVLRMDGDTTGRKGSHQEIIDNFRAGRAEVLVGTQMIAKGLDLPGVTLVGVINADTMLYLPDFRAAERTFQLLTQVAGRAGRGDFPGQTIVQTYTPQHYSIVSAQKHDYIGFYHQEMRFRRALKYPPFYYLARILISGGEAQGVETAAREIQHCLYQVAGAVEQEERKPIILGPSPAALSMIKRRFRWQLVIKGRMRRDVRLITAKSLKIWEVNSGLRNKVNVSIDIDPQVLI
ncbi:primosomal protein N' [Desulfofalx alkaliphila]|uniref:primosomal protein N' n=1 Tax=Desulfofalx alkaliphila TaxID=105483 RepID=UPI0004E0CEFF|nr:primosomal protein N' [Desulfofalx alkaliphila]